MSATFFISHYSHASCFARNSSPTQLNLGVHNETFWWNISVFKILCSDCVYAPFVPCECSVPETYWHVHSLKISFRDACACHHGNWMLNSKKKDPLLGWLRAFPSLGMEAVPGVWIVTEQLQRLMTGRNLFADDLVRVRIPYVNEIILNCSRWKKYILLVHILLIEKAKLDYFFLNYLLNSISVFSPLSSLDDILILCLQTHKSMTGDAFGFTTSVQDYIQ